MESLTYGASIIGLMVVGAMTASMIDTYISPFPLRLVRERRKPMFSDIINDIMPCLLPLLASGHCVKLAVRKKETVNHHWRYCAGGNFGSRIGLF